MEQFNLILLLLWEINLHRNIAVLLNQTKFTTVYFENFKKNVNLKISTRFQGYGTARCHDQTGTRVITILHGNQLSLVIWALILYLPGTIVVYFWESITKLRKLYMEMTLASYITINWWNSNWPYLISKFSNNIL